VTFLLVNQKRFCHPSKRSARLKQPVNLRARVDVLHLKDIIKPQTAGSFSLVYFFVVPNMETPIMIL
jgi:hypothetical protein